MKKLINVRLDEELLKQIEERAKKEGITKTQVIINALQVYLQCKDKCKDKTEQTNNDKLLSVLQEQNKELQQALKSFTIALQSKDELIKEKDKRIKELKETIELLKQYQEKNKKKWWQFWK